MRVNFIVGYNNSSLHYLPFHRTHKSVCCHRFLQMNKNDYRFIRMAELTF